MITYRKGDIFQSRMQTITNPVNTVGVMGKGLALEFKSRYPAMFARYVQYCKAGSLEVGKLWLYRAQSPMPWVLNFPTKIHWRDGSRSEWIRDGLIKLAANYEQQGIESLALPPLGCGNGGLSFDQTVRPLIEQHLSELPIEIEVYI